jgi:RimJ/RimL family protein N-acetyltransferase
MQHVGQALNQEAAIKLFNQFVNQDTDEQPKNQFYIIKNKLNDEKIGIIGLLWNQPKKNSVELGVMIARPYINKAYAYKATDMLMQYVFDELKLKSMIILCNEDNIVANRATKAIGFLSIGCFVNKKTNQVKVKWQITSIRFNQIKEQN